MDFCSWCEGQERSAELTQQGKTGGICKEHQAELAMTPEKIAELKEVYKRLRSK